MNAVTGFSELLLDDSLPIETKKRYYEIIDGNATQLLKLIDDIIDVAKIESGELKIKDEAFQLSELLLELEESFNQLKTKLNKKQIELRLEIPSEFEDIVIQTDRSRLQQVLSNLLNNAFKFSEKGVIEFGFKVKDRKILFQIKDEGIGIPPEKTIEIFERFKQINYENAAKYGGTGLGLAICKGIVEKLGGTLSVESQFGIGSTFTFDLPLNEIKTALIDKNKTADVNLTETLNDKKILIADDEKTGQTYLKEILKPYHTELFFADNGKEAVTIYSRNENIDLVLMDLRMPEMNGYKAIEAILKLNPKAKIIAQTAFAMPEEKQKCLDSGCVDYLSKPLSRELVLKTIAKWL